MSPPARKAKAPGGQGSPAASGAPGVRGPRGPRVGPDAEKWLAGLLDHPNALLFSVDAVGCIQWISPQVRTILGWDPERLVGQDAFRTLAAQGADEARSHYSAKRDGSEERSSYETKVRHRDGNLVTLDITSQAVRGKDGALLAVHVLGIDVSERRRAQEALERSRRRLESILDEASDVVYLHDFEGRFLSVNQAAVRLYGYSVDEFMRLSIRDLVDPEHLSRAAEQMRLKLEGVSRRSRPYELLTRTKAGRPVWVEVSTSAVLAEGKPVAVQGIARNINERKANEVALRVVQQVAFAAGETGELAETLATALEGLSEATGCARAEAWVPGSDGRIRLEASWPEERASVQAEKFHRLSLKASFGPGEGLLERLHGGSAPLWVPDLTQEPRFQRATAAHGAGLRAFLAVPVLAEDRLEALILLFTDEAGEAPPAWQGLVESVASQLGSMLRLRRSHDRLERQAHLLALQVDLAPVGVLLVGADGAVLAANRRFLDLCGISTKVTVEPLDGSFIRRLPDPESFLGKARDLYETDRLGTDHVQVGDRFLRRFVVDLPGPSGAPLARAVYLRDITETRRLEEELRSRKEILQDSPRP